jgi:2-methylcitrate dehydratase PrpD
MMPETVRYEAAVAALHASAPVVSPSTGRRARLLIADTLGCIAAGFVAPQVDALARRLSVGTFRWPGAPVALARSDAALAGAIAACWDEACEGLARAHGRPGLAPIASVVPLLAERSGSLGDAIAAIRFGYEVGGRFGEVLRIRPGMHVDATWPTLAAAAAVAHALGLDAAGTLAAIELAACQIPTSLYLPITQGATGRNLYLGHAARTGLDCATTVAAGIGAPTGAVAEARRIVFGAEAAAPALADPSLSLIDEGYLKPYAAVRHVHYGAAAAAALRPALAGRLERIDAIELAVYAEALVYCGNRAPSVPIQAQFSLSFGIAAMLATGDLGPDAYRRLEDPLLRALESKVPLHEDTARTGAGRRGATLRVFVDGGRLERSVDVVAGDPGVPMTEDEVRAKFIRYAGAPLGERRAAHLFDRLLEAPATLPLAALFDEPAQA